MRPIRCSLVIACVLGLLASNAHAQLRTETVVTGLSTMVGYIADPLNPGVFYAVQQSGLVRTVQNGTLLPAPFMDVRSAITCCGERGLLGMAFPPDASGRVFVNFTNNNGDTVVARFRRASANALTVDPASRFDLRWPNGNRFITQPFANHNGGHLAFGPDGYLYIGLGDGGSANDPQNNSQNPNQLLGKMLRIDVNVSDGDVGGYRIPPDNPFLDGVPVAALGEIWDFGLRNPWRYSFDDPALGGTGALFIGDVGQGAREEIDYEPAGSGAQNYGWRIREGLIATPGVGATTPAFSPLTDPLLDYDRSTGTTVTGGFVYRGRALGATYYGRYFFADYGAGRVWSVSWQPDAATGRAVVTSITEHTAELGTLGFISSFGVDLSGELYIVIYSGGSSGRVLRIVSDVGRPSAPTVLTASTAGRTVTLRWNAAAAGAPATQYRIEVGTRAGLSDLAVLNTGSLQTSFTAGAVPDGTYVVRVRAVNSGGTSDPTNELVITIGSGPCSGPPVAPTGLTSTMSGRIVSLTWSAPGNLTSITLEVGSGPGLSDLAIFLLDPTSVGISANAPPGRYYARVRATNTCGSSAASNEIVIVVNDPRP